MSNEKIKVYKNPARSEKENYKPYVPQYQLRGMEPEAHKSLQAPVLEYKTSLPLDKPIVPKAGIRHHPYAETVASPVNRIRGSVPNIGNNMEHTWSSVNEEIIDNLSGLDPDHAMIDNNEYISNAALGITEQLPMLDEVATPQTKIFSPKRFASQEDLNKIMQQEPQEDLFSLLKDLEEGTYLLIVNGVPVCSGPSEEIQDQARSLVFGEHELCDGNPIPVEDLLIIKRSTIKVGLFLE